MAYLLGAVGNGDVSEGGRLLGEDGAYLTDGASDTSSLDPAATVISQYANSPVLRALIDGFHAAADPSPNIDAFYDNVWNIDTATGYGLDVWGRIVGVSRVLTLPPSGDFGFTEDGGAVFGGGAFYSSALSTNNFELSDDAFRTLILVKAAANIGSATAQNTNALLRALFPGRGRCYAVDLGGMACAYNFEFRLQPFELAVLRQSGALPRPSGVQVFITQIDPTSAFGFAEGGFAPFGSGDFSGGPVHAG